MAHGESAATALKRKVNLVRLGAIVLCLLLVAAAVAWEYGLWGAREGRARQNSILVIAPYRDKGTWVFDDASVGLVKEPFVAGVPEMIDVLVKDIPTAKSGFRMLFSAQPFPNYQKELTWVRGYAGGNYYRMEDPPMEGWICPALFKYYAHAPEKLYVKAEAME